MAFLKLIRWPNLVIIALVQYLIRFFMIESLHIDHVLTRFEFLLGVVCSLCLAAAGYVVNDIFDQEADQRNKPARMVLGTHISVNNAWVIYGILNIIAILSGYLVAQAAGLPDLWLIPVVAIALLYLYSVDLKKRAVLGNLVVSLLVALPIFFVGVFDVLPAGTAENAGQIKMVFQVILAYSGFAFFTNFIREIIKDAEDLEGDRQEGYRTLAVLLGREHIRYVIIPLILVLLVFTGFFNLFLFQDFKSDPYSPLYVLIFINLPILYLIFKTFQAKEKLDFNKASNLIKIIMLTGIASMAVFTLVIESQYT